MDSGDDHLCGCDPAYACSDRFSWFAVPPSPSSAAARMPPLHLTKRHPDVTLFSRILPAPLSQPDGARDIVVGLRRCNLLHRRHEPSAMQPCSPHPASPRCCEPLVMRAAFRTNPRRADETSRSESGDPVCRPIRLCSGFRCSPGLRCQPLRGTLWAFKAARHAHVGPIPCAQASPFRQIFQVLFCCFFAGAQCRPLMPLCPFRRGFPGEQGARHVANIGTGR